MTMRTSTSDWPRTRVGKCSHRCCVASSVPAAEHRDHPTVEHPPLAGTARVDRSRAGPPSDGSRSSPRARLSATRILERAGRPRGRSARAGSGSCFERHLEIEDHRGRFRPWRPSAVQHVVPTPHRAHAGLTEADCDLPRCTTSNSDRISANESAAPPSGRTEPTPEARRYHTLYSIRGQIIRWRFRSSRHSHRRRP